MAEETVTSAESAVHKHGWTYTIYCSTARNDGREQKRIMLAKCKKALSSTPTTARQLLSPCEIMLAVIRFIATTRAGRCPQERGLEEKAEEGEAR